MAKIKRIDSAKHWQVCEILYMAGGMSNGNAPQENWQSLIKLSIHLPSDPRAPFPGLYTREMNIYVYTHTHTHTHSLYFSSLVLKQVAFSMPASKVEQSYSAYCNQIRLESEVKINLGFTSS